ncbi:MAG: hypothetical protein Q9180_009971, partial [Flavoplaca navasiana]
RFLFSAMAPLNVLVGLFAILPAAVTAVMQPGPPFVRLNKDDAMIDAKQMVIVADLQEGLYQVVRDLDTVTYRNNMLAHSAIASLFNIPIVLTTSAETGPNGVLPKEIASMYPSAPLIRRNGEVDAWDNSEFRDAVRAQNKSQIILAGITTDVCTEFLALSLRAEGFTVFANTEASGTFTDKLARDANDRMKDGGVILQ